MKIIFIIVAIFFVLKLLTRYLGPLLLMYASKKINKKINEQFKSTQDFQKTENHPPNNNPKKQNSKKTIGEYIDFEEID